MTLKEKFIVRLDAAQRRQLEGLAAAVQRKPPTGRQYRKLDGAQEARLVALACSPPPGGQLVHGVRAAGGQAARGSDRTPDQSGLRPNRSAVGGRVVPAG